MCGVAEKPPPSRKPDEGPETICGDGKNAAGNATAECWAGEIDFLNIFFYNQIWAKVKNKVDFKNKKKIPKY